VAEQHILCLELAWLYLTPYRCVPCLRCQIDLFKEKIAKVPLRNTFPEFAGMLQLVISADLYHVRYTNPCIARSEPTGPETVDEACRFIEQK